MAEHPAMMLWTDAYLADTTHLTTIEHGAYLLLLMAMWRTSSKSLPYDDLKLARFARLNIAQWRRMKPTLMALFTVDGDQITQGRLTDEAIAVKRKRKSQSDRAKAKWLKYREARDAAASSRQCRNDATLTHTHKEDSIPPTTPQEPSVLSECRPPGGEPAINGHAKPRAKPLGALMTEDWKPSAEAIRFCRMDLGCPADVLNATYQQFKDWGLSVTGPKARKRDWDRAFINAVRRDLREIREREDRERRWAERRGQRPN